MYGWDIFNRGGDRHSNPSTPRTISNHNHPFKTIKEDSLVLRIPFYNSALENYLLVVVLLRNWNFLKKLFSGKCPVLSSHRQMRKYE